jgi:hypothetical protein
MITPWNESPEPLDDDSLLPEEHELDDLADDYGWCPESETPVDDEME